MIEKRSNKQSASEDDLGLLHNLTTKMYILRLQRMFQLIDEGATVDAVFDDKVIKDAGVWAADKNGITCAAPEADSETELAKELGRIKEAQKDAKYNGNVAFLDGQERGHG